MNYFIEGWKDIYKSLINNQTMRVLMAGLQIIAGLAFALQGFGLFIMILLMTGGHINLIELFSWVGWMVPSGIVFIFTHGYNKANNAGW